MHTVSPFAVRKPLAKAFCQPGQRVDLTDCTRKPRNVTTSRPTARDDTLISTIPDPEVEAVLGETVFQRASRAAYRLARVLSLSSPIGAAIVTPVLEEAGLSPLAKAGSLALMTAGDWLVPGLPAGTGLVLLAATVRNPSAGWRGMQRLYERARGAVEAIKARVSSGKGMGADGADLALWAARVIDEADDPQWALAVLYAAYEEMGGDVGKAIGVAEEVIGDAEAEKALESYTKDMRAARRLSRPMFAGRKSLAQTLYCKSTSQDSSSPRKFSSTQFDLDLAGYPRSQGSPVPLIREVQKQIREEDLADDGKESNIHITVKYGLHTDSPENVARIVNGHKGISVTLGAISIFPASEASAQRGGAEYDVVKIDVESEDLRKLNQLLSDSLQHTDTHPEYKPHITLAYVKPGQGKKYSGSWNGEGMVIHCIDLTFSGKSGEKKVISLSKFGINRSLFAGRKSLARQIRHKANDSYFSHCERDDSGQCLPEGESGSQAKGESASKLDAPKIAAMLRDVEDVFSDDDLYGEGVDPDIVEEIQDLLNRHAGVFEDAVNANDIREMDDALTDAVRTLELYQNEFAEDSPAGQAIKEQLARVKKISEGVHGIAEQRREQFSQAQNEYSAAVQRCDELEEPQEQDYFSAKGLRAKSLFAGRKSLARMVKDWVRYQGPRGGQGWRQTRTGEVIYQDEKPGSESEKPKKKPQRAKTPSKSDLKKIDNMEDVADRLGMGAEQASKDAVTSSQHNTAAELYEKAVDEYKKLIRLGGQFGMDTSEWEAKATWSETKIRHHRQAAANAGLRDNVPGSGEAGEQSTDSDSLMDRYFDKPSSRNLVTLLKSYKDSGKTFREFVDDIKPRMTTEEDRQALDLILASLGFRNTRVLWDNLDEVARKLSQVSPHKGKPFVLKKKQVGEGGIGHMIEVDGKVIGHIAGFEQGNGNWFDIMKTEIHEEYRGSGIFPRAIQKLADSYPGGVKSLKVQTSRQFAASMRKMPTFRETEEYYEILPSKKASEKSLPPSPFTARKSLAWLVKDRSGSYFARCERDDEGHCKPEGAGGDAPKADAKPGKPKKPKKTDEDKAREFEAFLKSKTPQDAEQFRKAHADGIAIPPAWTEVTYYGKDKDVYAEGRDAKGRKQRAENPDYRQRVSDENNARIARELTPRMNELRRQLRDDAASGDEEAKVLYLISMTGFRIGGKGDGKAKVQAFGASTLEGSHVTVSGDTVAFDFPGKKGVQQRHTITDPVIADMMRDKPDGKIFQTNDAKVRKAWQERYGGTKVHDIRHVVSSEIAQEEISKRIPPPPKNDKEKKALIKEIATVAAHKLGNNPTQALETYIDPGVWKQLEMAA